MKITPSTVAMLCIVLSFLAVLIVTATLTAAPCQYHKGEGKQTCKRAQMDWPPNPSVKEVRTRVDKIGGKGTWEKAWRIARCETGANPRHFPHGSYIGMMGMFRSTYAYGARVTGYPYPDVATPQQQIAVAVASWPITRQWQGWGCRGA